MATKRSKATPAIHDDVPFTARLPDGRTLFVLIPARWCALDASGEVLLKPEAARFIDRVQAMATRTPGVPTPGYIRSLREAMGLTQADFAGRVGVDSMTVSRWERGAVRPGPAAVKALDKLRREAGRRGTVIAA
ncbi:MAG: helix-turn-helix domain-containing protein [Phycisphaerae bacterium]|nr:helix-turn-helix domain-containing protein [Phycisphaerae bacterium]